MTPIALYALSTLSLAAPSPAPGYAPAETTGPEPSAAVAPPADDGAGNPVESHRRVVQGRAPRPLDGAAAQRSIGGGPAPVPAGPAELAPTDAWLSQQQIWTAP